MAATIQIFKRLATVALAAAGVALAGGPALGANPGLPFTEDFANPNLRDDALTDATWGGGTLELGEASTLTNLSTTASPLGADEDSETRDIVAGDFDGDGDLDLIAANDGDPNLIYFNDGGFANPGLQVSSDAFRSRAIAAADIDGDGDTDFVEGYNGQPPRLYRNRGDGTFAAPLQLESGNIAAWDIGIADLDLDGDLDVVIAVGRRNSNNQENRNRIYRNQLADTGSLSFTAENVENARRDSRALAIGDLNGDGYPDLVFGEFNNLSAGGATTGENSVYLSVEGDFGDRGVINPAANETFAIALGDVTGDGNLDVVEGNQQQVTLVYPGNGDGTFGASATVGNSSNTDTTVVLVVEDFDRDTDLDIVEGNNPQTKRLFLNQGNGTFSNAVAGAFPDEVFRTYGMATGDFDLDGDRDLAAGHQRIATGTPPLPITTNNLYTLDGTETGNVVRQLSSVAVSLRVDDGSVPEIPSVKLEATQSVTPGESEVRYFVSNTNGASFVAAQPGQPIAFPNATGNALKWRAELEATSGAAAGPVVNQIDISVNNAPVWDNTPPCGDGTFLASEVESRQCVFGPLFTENDPGDTLTFSVTGLPAGTGFSVDSVNGILSGQATNADVAAEPIDVQFIASDGALQTSVSGRIRIRENQQVNDPPTISGPNPDALVTTPEDTAVEIVLENVLFDDPDGPDAYTLEVIEDATGLVYSNVGNVITPIAAVPPGETETSIDVQVVVSDSIDDSPVFNLPITLTDVNFPPEVATPIEDQVGTEGVDFTLDVSGNFTDKDQDPLTFTQTGLPGGMSISPAGIISGMPAAGFFDVTVTADDGNGDGTASDTFTFAVQSATGNNPPQVTGPIGDRTAVAGEPISFDTNAFFDDPDDDVLTYSATGLPASLSIDAATGVVSGTPTADDVAASPFAVTVTVTDPGMLTASDSLQLTVESADANNTPQLVQPIADRTAFQGQAASFDTASAFSDPDGDELTFSATGLPPSLSIDAATGLITGTPTADDVAASPFAVTVRATDPGDLFAEGGFQLTVEPEGAEDTIPPVVTLNGDAEINVQQGTTFTDPGATATDNVDGDLTDAIVVEGTVDTSTLGTYTLVYRATDAAGNVGEATRTVNVVADAPPVVTLNGASTVSIRRGNTFTDPGATATDDVDGDLTDQIVVTGNVDTSTAGTYTLVYSVTDSAGNEGRATRTVTVTGGGGGGGGGATGLWLLAGLIGAVGLRRRRCR